MKRLSMRKTREILRLSFEAGLSNRQIAHSAGIARSTVADYIARFTASGLSWPLPETLTETELNQRLFTTERKPGVECLQPDWPAIHKELRRPGVTLMLLWQEYRQQDPGGYQYSWFCDQYRQWACKLDVVMRQQHRAGEKLFIDYAGQTVAVTDPATGDVRQAQIFVATLGASSYTYAEATWSQSLEDWVGSHVRTFEFLGGVPECLVPDNLRSGVSKAHRYEPDINPTYQDLAEHYRVAVVPARVRKPQDKGKVESAVQVVERWILARLRDQTFFSLGELNTAIHKLLEELNNTPFQKLPGSRRLMFESLDRPALNPLPTARYEFAQWKEARVHIDYHIEVDGHYYSVPYQLVKKQLSVRITRQTIECLYKGERVASHRRSYQRGRHTTLSEYMPEKHRQYASWTPERLQRWAASVGPETQAVITRITESRRHPEQTCRSCLGIMRLGKSYGNERLESACRRAIYLDTCACRSIESILRNSLDQQPLPEPVDGSPLPDQHENLRGSAYYH